MEAKTSSPERELQLLKQALDESAIVAITDHQGKITHVNKKFCEISKYEREELIGKTHKIINSGFHSSEFFQEMWNTIRSGKVWEGEIRNRAKDGSHYWVNTCIVPFTDKDGVPYQYVSIRYDITKRMKMMEQLEEREEDVRHLFNASFEGILLHQLDGTILDVNETAGNILGGSREDIVGKNIHDFFERTKNATPFTAQNAVAPHAYQTSCTSLTGNQVPLEVMSKPFSWKGTQAILTSCRDISERVQMQTQILQQDRLASIGLLASSLAHEIGTPLGVIRGRAELLAAQKNIDPITLQCSEIIVSQIDRVSKLVRALLSLGKNAATLKVASVEVDSILSEVSQLLQHEFQRRGVTFECSVDPKIEAKAESGSLHQIFFHLLVNSLHAIDEAERQGRKGGHVVRVQSEDAGSYWKIKVEDTGCGISIDNMKHLFKPFFTTKEVGEGSGLGLATSYRVIERWGGSISAQSKQGMGTIFQILLPKASEKVATA